MKILVWLLAAIGFVSTMRWAFTKASALFYKHLVKQPGQQPTKKKKYIRIGHERKLVCFDDLPEANKYKGRTWLGGLPVYADIVSPDKHDYSTIIYMDHWFKQYVHDVMLGLGIPSTKKEWEGLAYHLFFPVMFILAGVNPIAVSVVAILFFAWEFLLLTPKACRATRRMGENAKNFTPQDWANIAVETMKSLEREQEMTNAIRKAGVYYWRH